MAKWVFFFTTPKNGFFIMRGLKVSRFKPKSILGHKLVMTTPVVTRSLGKSLISFDTYSIL